MTHQDFLFKILDILEKNNITYTLFAGTLLGAVRDKGFLPSDHKDTDIALKAEDYWTVRYLFNKEILNNSIKWYGILRRELSVTDIDNQYKVDMFFVEQGDNNAGYVYSYKQNPETKKWDYEWRAIFPYQELFTTIKISFLNRLVNIPLNYDLILTTEYGNWRTPQPQWISSDKTVLNNDNNYIGFYPAGINPVKYKPDISEKTIGFICINFIRKDSTKKCILSLQQYYPHVKIYIADQDLPSGEMIEFYEQHNVEYYYLPYDCGIAKCRNFLINKVKEPYLMWGDNDFIFTTFSNLDHAISILNACDEIGFVGGSILINNKQSHYERILSYLPEYKILIYLPLELTNPPEYEIGNIRFYYCDLTFNYVICRTEILANNQQLRWNELLKCRYEHTDIFLRIKQYGQKKVVYCPSFTVQHCHDFSDKKYNNLRHRRGAAELFANSWGLDMNFTVGQGHENYHITYQEEDKLHTVPEITLATEHQLEVIHQLLNILLKDNELFWLLSISCIEAVTTKQITSLPLYIGVTTNEIKNTILEKIPKELKDFIDISVEINRKIKQFQLQDYKIHVPSPVTPYLKRRKQCHTK
jgi:GT2 family glycosyltransferase